MSLDAYECIQTKLDVREFDSEKDVPADVKLKVLEAGRLTGSGINNQHWRFILVQGQDGLRKLAQDSTSGKWVENANFAMILLTNPKYSFHLIDAGRAAQDMMLAAWNSGVASCIFTGTDKEALQRDFSIPKEMTVSLIVGFGYPARKLSGRKNRKPLTQIAYLGRYGHPVELNQRGSMTHDAPVCVGIVLVPERRAFGAPCNLVKERQTPRQSNLVRVPGWDILFHHASLSCQGSAYQT